jgi:glycosyltransferase involved in cell wall biosynthesis
LVHTLKVPARKVRLLGNGIDLQRFRSSAVDVGARARLRAEWGVGDHEVVCGTVGRLVAEKGIVELVDAAVLLRERGVPARLVVVGPTDDDKTDALPPQMMSTAAASGVVFTGRRDDMPECYSAFDLFVTASWREGFPRAAMEAAAMGLPTVATDIRGNRQVVVPGVTGELVAVRSAPALAAACERLVTDGAARAREGAAAAQRALTEFGDQAVIDRTLAAYALLRRR